MAIAAKFIPQLLTYNDERAQAIVRNLKKVEIRNEYQLVDLGVKEYVSLPKLDQKAFRYVVKNGKLYLRESVYSVGGLVQDSVLINLGEFTEGMDETGTDLEYLAKIKDAKAKQRRKQLREMERLAQSTLTRINKQVKNAELRQQWQQRLDELKMFVRLGKPDFYQSQVDVIAKFAPRDETLAKIVVDYQTKVNAQNEKWLTEPVKLTKGKAKPVTPRVGVQPRDGIGEINPENRTRFTQYYAERAPQMAPYLSEATEVTAELPLPPTVLYEKKESKTVETATAAVTVDQSQQALTTATITAAAASERPTKRLVATVAQKQARVRQLQNVFTARETKGKNVVINPTEQVDADPERSL